MNQPGNTIRGMVTTEELESCFRSMYPAASEEEVAALMADFLEEVPATTILDDGALSQADANPEWRVCLRDWIGRLKEFASDAYPPSATLKASAKKE